MSQRSGHVSEYGRHHPQDPRGHQQRRAPQQHARPAQQGSASDYTIVHAGRQVRFGPVVFWIVVGTVIIMGAWSGATATYFAFRDDVLTRLIARQAEMQYAYEDRIAELRAKVDRTTSRQLLDQEQFDQKLEQVMRRQATLESRAAALGSLPDSTATGSIRPQTRSDAGSLPTPSPVGDTVVFAPPPDREARLQSRTIAVAAARPAEPFKVQGFDTTLAKLQSALDKVETKQAATLNAVEESYESRARRMRSVFTDLGLEMPADAKPRSGIGGPFIPVKPGTDSAGFERQLQRISVARTQVERLTKTLAVVPYRKPVIGEVEFSSGFGVRSDPFLGRPAMHSGLDFRASTGDPVRATANGKVVTAGWQGGYGRLVEIDHGNTLSTRYGHLSEIHVKVGDTIRIGQVIGAVGSTGRSTGPHLHYETRVDGDAVDPQRFLRAGVRLSSN